MDLETTETAKVLRVARLGTRQLTRAHLVLSRRPQVRLLAAQALAAACDRLSHQLGVAVSAQARLVESAVAPRRASSALAAFAVLELSALGELALLEVELPALGALAGRLLGGPPAPPVSFALTRMEEAAFGFLCLLGLSAARGVPELERLFGPRLVSVHADREAALEAIRGPGRWTAVQLSFKAGEDAGGARLWLPAEPLQCALAEVPEPPQAPIAPELLTASLPARVRAGRTQLDLEAAEQLVAGDVVLFESLRLSEGQLLGPARLSAAGFELAGELLPQGFSLVAATAAALPQEVPMSAEPLAVTSPLPSLSVDVEIELTRVRLSLAELSAIRPGSLLPLRCNAAEPVTLWIGDRAVARAELVEIEGELGARILHLNP